LCNPVGTRCPGTSKKKILYPWTVPLCRLSVGPDDPNFAYARARCKGQAIRNPTHTYALLPSPEIIRLAVMLYIRYPLSLRNVEDLLHESGIEISHETV
jgi:hypothetical protein